MINTFVDIDRHLRKKRQKYRHYRTYFSNYSVQILVYLLGDLLGVKLKRTCVLIAQLNSLRNENIKKNDASVHNRQLTVVINAYL